MNVKKYSDEFMRDFNLNVNRAWDDGEQYYVMLGAPVSEDQVDQLYNEWKVKKLLADDEVMDAIAYDYYDARPVLSVEGRGYDVDGQFIYRQHMWTHLVGLLTGEI